MTSSQSIASQETPILSYTFSMSCVLQSARVARMRERRGACRALVGKPEGRIPLERPRRRWKDNIKMDLREVGWAEQTGLIWLRIGTGGGLLCIRR
jgi:hypothetical protein